jgi:Carboxypeptidase regulatory-like domain
MMQRREFLRQLGSGLRLCRTNEVEARHETKGMASTQGRDIASVFLFRDTLESAAYGFFLLRRLSGMLSRVLLLAALAFPLLAATDALPPLPHEDSIALRGTVVSSVDGTPVRGALVQLLGTNTRAMLTGGNGTFEFEGLAAGDGIVVVRKPGYFSSQEYFPESVGELRVHLSPSMKALELKLYPEAVIYGRVTNENGRPLEGLAVQLFHAGMQSPPSKGESLPSVITNENGEYRLPELHEGTYLISVSQRKNSEDPIALFQAAKMKSGYPTAFYPGVEDPKLATPIRLTPGKQVMAGMQIHSQPLYRVAGNVLGVGETGPVFVVLVGRHDIQPVSIAVTTPPLTGFVLEGVPAGSYFLGGIVMGDEKGSEERSGFREMEISGNVEGASLGLEERSTFQVRFQYQYERTEANTLESSGAFAKLQRTDMPLEEELFSEQLYARPDVPGLGTDIQLDSGKYRVKLISRDKVCVASVKSGATNLMSDDLAVSAGGSDEPIEVVVRNDCGGVRGNVSKDGQPAMGRVLLIPEGAPRAGISTAANSDGGFQATGLAPGKYVVVALDGADDLAPDDPDTQEKVKSRGTTIEVLPSGSTNITLELKSLEP